MSKNADIPERLHKDIILIYLSVIKEHPEIPSLPIPSSAMMQPRVEPSQIADQSIAQHVKASMKGGGKRKHVVQKRRSANTTIGMVRTRRGLMCFCLALLRPLFTQRRGRHTESSCSAKFGPHGLQHIFIVAPREQNLSVQLQPSAML